MSRPAKACRLCPRFSGFTVQVCNACGNRFCLKHIDWRGEFDAWLCSRDYRSALANQKKEAVS